MSGELGRASYDLTADLSDLRREMAQGRREVGGMEEALDALTAISELAETALKRVEMNPNQAAQTRATASAILAGVRGISDESRDAARELDRVRISEAQATESVVAGERIKRNINDIGDEADRTTRRIERMQVVGGVPGRTGVGVGPFGSGFGRVGLMGTAVAGGVLTGPAFGPALAGILAATPVMAGAAAGALGTLALAFRGVGAAIGGDKKAFDSLTPSAQQFTLTIRSLQGWVKQLKETAASSLFPGLERGLRDALSPQTLDAVTVAVRTLGSALGQAGEMWGRYFGSAAFRESFGPLMQSAARTITTLSSAALNLFDALGVLSRAAIPLTDWMTRGVDRSTAMVNAWLRASEASGALGRSMTEAQASLRLVGGLLGAIVNVLGALGQALYPVSKVAVRDLTDGLNELARIISRNKEAIRDLVGGALAALVGLVKEARNAVAAFWPVLKKAVDLIGGWKTAFELLIGMKLATVIAGWTASFQKLAGAQALGGASTAAEGLLGKMTALQKLGVITIGLVIVEQIIPKPPNTGDKWDPSQRGILSKIPVVGTVSGWGAYIGTALGTAITGALGVSSTNYAQPAGSVTMPTARGQLTGGALKSAIVAAARKYGVDPVAALAVAAAEGGFGGAVGDGGNAFGPFQLNNAGGVATGMSPTFLKAWANSRAGVEWAMQKIAGVSKGMTGYDAVRAIVTKFERPADGGAGDMRRATAFLMGGGAGSMADLQNGGGASPFGAPPPFTKNLGPAPAVPRGDALLSSGLRAALDRAKNNVTTAAGPGVAGRWLNVELDLLEKARQELADDLVKASGKKRAAIKDEMRSIDREIAAVNKAIATNLKEQAAAIRQSFTPRLQAARSGIGGAMSALRASLDSQFGAATQGYIDSVLGPKYFQGVDAAGKPLMTPLEQQLQAMQLADQRKQLTDAVAAADTEEARAAAQRQLDMYDLAARAADERAQADRDYAQAVKKYETERAELQRQLNVSLDNFEQGLSTGTTRLDDLAAIVGEFGLSLSGDAGISRDFDMLGGAVRALALVMAQEAVKLAGVGDKKGARAALDILDRLTAGSVSNVGSANAASSVDAAGNRIYYTDGAWYTAAGLPVAGMAEGGIGSVSMPTLFLAGEAGPEEFAFSGAGRTLTDRFSGGGDTATVRSFGNEIELGLYIGRLMQKANKSGIRFSLV